MGKKKKKMKMFDYESPKDLIAKKDFVIHWNDYHLEIKKGDDLSKVPSRFLENLKTEGVI